MQDSQNLDYGVQALITKYSGHQPSVRKEVGDKRDTYSKGSLMLGDSQYTDRFQLIEDKKAPTTFKALESFGEKIVQQTPIASRDHHHDTQFLNAIQGGLSGESGLDPN